MQRHLKRAHDLEWQFNVWLWYERRGKRGFAQPDVFVVLEDKILLLEIKLTQTESVEAQLAFYAALLRKLYARDCVLLQVCRNLRYAPAHEILRLEELLDIPPGPTIHTLHMVI